MLTHSDIDQIENMLDQIAQNAAIWDEAQLAERSAALNQIEFPILATLTSAHTTDDAPRTREQQITILTQRANILQHDLTAINTQLFQRLRRMLMSPMSTPYERQRLLREYGFADQHSTSAFDRSYDHLDVLINGVLQLNTLPDINLAPLASEMVCYQPTPAWIIFDLIEHAAITPADIFYDLGSGLGHVAILVAILTGATAVGVEIDPALCAAAQQCAISLHASTVSILQADVRTVDLTAGTIFYLYTPFTGTILQDVLDQLRSVATQHPIRIYTTGPYLSAVAEQLWLRRMASPAAQASAIAMFTSREQQSTHILPEDCVGVLL